MDKAQQEQAQKFWQIFLKSRPDWDQQELARTIEVGESSVSDWFTGKTKVSVGMLAALLQSDKVALSPKEAARLVKLYLPTHGFTDKGLFRLTRALLHHNAPHSLADVPAFWRPLLADKLQIVVGRHPIKRGEIGGLLSWTDTQAVEALRMYLRQYGLCHLPVTYNDEGRTDYAQGFKEDELSTNVVLLGGSVVNPAARRVLERVDLRFRFEERRGRAKRGKPWLVIRDSVKDQEWKSPAVSKKNPEIHEDHAIIIRAENPFEPSKELLLVAGIHGYATWGGVQALLSEEFVQELQTSHGLSLSSEDHFECVVNITVGDFRPKKPTVLEIRRLRKPPAR